MEGRRGNKEEEFSSLAETGNMGKACLFTMNKTER